METTTITCTEELKAMVREECTVYPDATAFLLHPGEAYDIDRMGNEGVIIVTPFGEATLAWRSFTWHDCGVLCAEHGSPLDTSIDVVRLSKCADCGHPLSEHEDVAADLREPSTWVCHGGDFDCGCKERAAAGGWAGCEHFCHCHAPARLPLVLR
jgi:hypothetical protein